MVGLSSSKTVGAANATIRCSRSECCSPSFAWTHSLAHRRCRRYFFSTFRNCSVVFPMLVTSFEHFVEAAHGQPPAIKQVIRNASHR